MFIVFGLKRTRVSWAIEVDCVLVLTSNGVCGASIEPMRPIMEQTESKLFRTLVGKISEVKKYKI